MKYHHINDDIVGMWDKCKCCNTCCAKGQTGMVISLYTMFLAFIAMMINIVTGTIVIVRNNDLWTGIAIFGAAVGCLNIFLFAGKEYIERKRAIKSDATNGSPVE